MDTTVLSLPSEFARIGGEVVGYVTMVISLLCSGQTGSGKTFTMIGPNDDSDVFTHDLRGIIPRSFEYLFNLINREQLKVISPLLVVCVIKSVCPV